jgi:glycosyltransferase involved in cell wall biosynthesis
MAVRVLAELRRTHPEAVLSMYGVDKDGTLGGVRRLAQQLGVAQAVRFPGVVPKHLVGEALAEADIFLNTARVDNMPISLMEAMACGLCVVSTNVGGVPYVVRDGINGLLVPAGSPTAMTEAVHRLLEDAELSSRLSREARQWAEQFGWERILPCWLELLESIASGRGGQA